MAPNDEQMPNTNKCATKSLDEIKLTNAWAPYKLSDFFTITCSYIHAPMDGKSEPNAKHVFYDQLDRDFDAKIILGGLK